MKDGSETSLTGTVHTFITYNSKKRVLKIWAIRPVFTYLVTYNAFNSTLMYYFEVMEVYSITLIRRQKMLNQLVWCVC